MRERPLIVKLVTWFLCCVPPFGALGLIYFSRFKVEQLISILSWQLYFLVFVCYVTAYGVWKVRKWGFVLFFTFIAIVAGFDIYSAIQNRMNYPVWYLVDFALILTGVLLFQIRNVAEPYFNPQVRWWERASRYRIDLIAQFTKVNQPVSIPLLDVSESGCFAVYTPSWNSGEQFFVSFRFLDITFESQAELIRHSETPKGTGFRFFNTSRANRLNMRKIIKHLERNSKDAQSSLSPRAPA